MALLLMMGWGALLLGALWLKAGRPRPLGAPPAPAWTDEGDLGEGHLPSLWAQALLLPLCLWLVAAGAGQPQGDWPQLVTLGALSVVLWVSVLCLSGGGDAPAEG